MSERLNEKMLGVELEQMISPEEEKLKEEYKKLLIDIGMEGKYQRLLFRVFCMAAFLCCLLLTSFPLQKDIPEHYCVNKQDFVDNSEGKFNIYKADSKRFSIITETQCVEQICFKKEEIGEGVESHNKMVENQITDEKLNPRNTVLIVDNKSVTNFVTELNVICKMESFFGTMTQMLFLGRIIGNFVFAYVSDKYGRLICFKLQVYTIVVCHLIFFFVKVDWVYILVALVASGCLNTYNLVSAMSTEMMSQKMYSLLNGLLGASFTLTGLIDIVVLYFLKNWNILLLLHFLVSGVVVYAMTYYLTETPIFLLDQGNYRELSETIKKMATVNETYESQNVKNRLDALKEFRNINKIKSKTEGFFNSLSAEFASAYSSRRGSAVSKKPENFIESISGPYMIAFKSKETSTQFLKILFVYLTMNFVFYGQVLNVEKMNGNIYFNSFIIYTAEIISEISAGYFLQNYGRRQMIIACFGLSTFFCFLLNIIEISGGSPVFFTMFIFLNSFFISITFVVIYVYSAELFDSNVKSTMVSLLVNLSNVFLLTSPYLIAQFTSPFGLFCILSLGACLNGFILKETKLEEVNSVVNN